MNETYQPQPDYTAPGAAQPNFFEKNKKLITIAAAALAGLIVLILIINAFTGSSYKTPINNAQKMISSESLTIKSVVKLTSCGYCQSEILDVINNFKGTDKYTDFEDDLNDRDVDEKYKLKISDKEELDKTTLKDVKNNIKALGEKYIKLADTVRENAEDYADEWGVKGSDIKDISKDIKALGEKLKKADVSKGYKVWVEIIDEDGDSDEKSIMVYCVNGKWISTDNFYGALTIVDEFIIY